MSASNNNTGFHTFTINNDELPPGMSLTQLQEQQQGAYGVATKSTGSDADIEVAAADGEADFLADLHQQEALPPDNTNNDNPPKTGSNHTSYTSSQTSHSFSKPLRTNDDEKTWHPRPFYKTMWFLVVIVIVVIAAVGGVVGAIIVGNSNGGDNDGSTNLNLGSNNGGGSSSPPTNSPEITAPPTGSPVSSSSGGSTETDSPSTSPSSIPSSTPLINLQTCQFDSDCDNNACGFSAFTTSADKVCCPSGATVSNVYRPDGTINSQDYCTSSIPGGDACGQDSMCTTGACALESWTVGATAVCCPTGSRTLSSIQGPEYTTYFESGLYCAGLSNGEICGDHSMCASNACVKNICEPDKGAPLESCNMDSDCQNQACGFSNYTMEATKICCPSGLTVRESQRPNGAFESQDYCGEIEAGDPCGNDSMCSTMACAIESWTRGAPVVCCEYGTRTPSFIDGPEYETYFESGLYCGGLPDGEICGDDAMCASNACVQNICEPDKGAPLESCNMDSDCQNGACGFSNYTIQATKICCPSGATVGESQSPNGEFDSQDYCTQIPAGDPCGNDSMCSTGACAIESWTIGAPVVCCEFGARTPSFIDGPDPESFDSGKYCGGLPDGEICGDDAMCASNACVQNICEPDKGALLESCNMDSDCDNQACGFSNYTMEATKICCPSGATVGESQRPNGAFESQDYCGEIEAGDPCGNDSMCSTGACAIESWTIGAPVVCCQYGARTPGFIGRPDSGSDKYCGGLPNGEICGDHSMCASNACVQNVCEPDRATALESCTIDDDCQNEACGLSNYTMEAIKVCCPSNGTTRESDRPDGVMDSQDYCTGYSSGAACGNNAMCLSATCSGNICQ